VLEVFIVGGHAAFQEGQSCQGAGADALFVEGPKPCGAFLLTLEEANASAYAPIDWCWLGSGSDAGSQQKDYCNGR
jgi:hypothetical protein